MTYDEFLDIIQCCKEVEEFVDKAHELNMDFFETKIFENYYHLLDAFILQKEFNTDQIDCFYQWLYECNFGEKPIVYYDTDDKEHEKRCTTTEELFKFLESLK